MNVLILISLAVFAFFILGAFCIKKLIVDKQINKAKENSDKILNAAKEEAERIKSETIINAKEEIYKFRENAEKEYFQRYQDFQIKEQKIFEKEEFLNKKIEFNEILEKKSQEKIKECESKLDELEKIKWQQLEELKKISKIKPEEAKNKIMKILSQELAREKSELILDFRKSLDLEKEKIAQNVVVDVVSRCSCDYILDVSVSVIKLSSDEMKGCIIGREGRNIRTLENLTGVDIIVDDTPETITVSSFDPYRREIAKVAINLLISDGRIQPAKIEEMVEKAKNEVDKGIEDEGQRAILDLKICEIHPELIELIGRLKYRTSYGQNALKHSMEVAYISGLLASEMGLDSSLARRCGLLHDIGKALTSVSEGSHVDIGVKLLKKYDESKEVINAVAAHHGDCKPESAIAIIIQAADSISASRPGARKENLEDYIKRISKLESIANEFDAVERCYAIQAGREIRVVVSPEKISDDEMVLMAREICKKIEENVNYAGQIKVQMIRESRYAEYAK